MVRQDPVSGHNAQPLGSRELAAHYRALADETRLRIVSALWRDSGDTVTDLCQTLRVSQPLMSWHLRILRRAGIVMTHREGRQVRCGLSPHILEENGSLLASYLRSSAEREAEVEGPSLSREGHVSAPLVSKPKAVKL